MRIFHLTRLPPNEYMEARLRMYSPHASASFFFLGCHEVHDEIAHIVLRLPRIVLSLPMGRLVRRGS